MSTPRGTVSIELARQLAAAGLEWSPQPGDWFVVDQPEMLEQAFVVSEMTVDVHDFPAGPVIGFNGTVEWALDSVEKSDTVWLPLEHQLRERLGASLLSLQRGSQTFRVLTDDGSFEHARAAEAYGLALLHRLKFTFHR